MVDILTNPSVGNAASVFGLVISIIGFAVTIRNVVKSRAAAEETQRAVQRVQREIARLDAMADVAAAISTMEEIKRLQRELAWKILPDRYAALRKHLITIKSSFTALRDEQKVALQNAIQHFAGIEDLLESTPSEQLSQKHVARLNRTVSSQADALQEVLVEIRSTQIG